MKLNSHFKNYLAKGTIGLSLMALSCSSGSQNLSIYEKGIISSMKDSQHILLNKSKDYICLARKKLNNSVKDFYIDIFEQKEIKNCYDSANDLIKLYNTRSLSVEKTFSNEDNKYYNALKKNLERIDIGKPKLEKIITKETGYLIKSQSYNSNQEKNFLGGIGLAGLIFFIISMSCIPFSLIPSKN